MVVQESAGASGDLSKPTEAGDGFDVLNYIAWEWDVVCPAEMSGHFVVAPKICQPFGILHGGITAFLAETLGSLGAQVASKWARVAGVDLTVNHLLSVPVGNEVIAKAKPLRVGKRIQIWDVNFTTPGKNESSSTEPPEFVTFAVARLTVLVGLPDPGKAAEGNAKLIAFARKNNIELAPNVSKL